MSDRILWKVKTKIHQWKAKLELFWVLVDGIGWWGIFHPVVVCEDCGKVYRILYWFIGDHRNCQWG